MRSDDDGRGSHGASTGSDLDLEQPTSTRAISLPLSRVQLRFRALLLSAAADQPAEPSLRSPRDEPSVVGVLAAAALGHASLGARSPPPSPPPDWPAALPLGPSSDMSSYPIDVVDFDENVPPCTYPNLNTMTQVRRALRRAREGGATEVRSGRPAG
jgi:hypothetical protein